MGLNLYCTYSRNARVFEPLHGHEVGLYACGPTVYDYAHIGNLRTYLFVDLLRRALEANGYSVRHVMNITDVGHLVSDGDDGEDKMEKGSRRSGKDAWQIAREYTTAFEADLDALNILRPVVQCRATDHIAEQISFVEDLERKGFTYRTSDGIYFDTSRQDNYGYLARLDPDGLQAGKRVELGEKRRITDFALWKLSAPGERRQMEWDSPWGRGFPGWHIECSAMSEKHLGDYFDIHCGGEDHVPVHHTNEIAQTEARHGTRLANFWLHGAFLTTSGEKISKSSGDFLRLQSLVDDGYDPLAYRYLCLTAHYRGQLSFSFEALDAAATAIDRLRQALYKLERDVAAEVAINATQMDRFMEAINDDLNAPRALAVLWETIRGELPPSVKYATVIVMDKVLGLNLANWQAPILEVSDEVRQLLNERQLAREQRLWAESDRLRAVIRDLGYEVEDGSAGQSLRKTNRTSTQ